MTELRARVPDDIQPEESDPVNRLCNEIKLFDLCDLDRCSHRSGNFCTNRELLVRFERIADAEERHSGIAGYDDCDDEEGDAYDDGFDSDECGDDTGEYEDD